MTGRATPMRRLAASVGAVALTAGGMLAMVPAFADTPDNITDQPGSIIVHKHVEDEENSSDGQPAGAPLEGVRFKVQEVLHDGNQIDLSTAEGWEQAEKVFDETAPALPSGGFSLVDIDDDVTGSDGTVTFDVNRIGVYLVTEIHPGENLITSPAAPFWVTVPYSNDDGGWDYDVHVYPKNVLGEPGTPTKEADEEAAVVGDEVTWTITMPVAESPLPYNSFTIKDDLSANPYLTFAGWGDVLVDGVELAAADYGISADDSTITFTPSGLAKLNDAGDTTVEVTLVTTVVSIPEDGIITNEVTVTINGSPGEAEGTTNWGEIKLHKYSDADETDLSGAEFELYAADADGNKVGSAIATGTTGSDGMITWTVWVGNDEDVSKDFVIVETKAPAGHVLPETPETPITVEAGKLAEGMYSANIANHKPDVPQLPLTGAQGTMVFLLVGLGLIGAGGTIAGVRRSRMNS